MTAGVDEVVAELSTRSEAFRDGWAAHDVRVHTTEQKCVRHPTVGDLTITFEAMQLNADAGLTMAVDTAEAGSPSEAALRHLAAWTATLDDAEFAQATNGG